MLTAAEADEVLGLLRSMTRSGEVSVLMISHKFREVMTFADRATVLRRGLLTGDGLIGELDVASLSEMMVGSAVLATARCRQASDPS